MTCCCCRVQHFYHISALQQQLSSQCDEDQVSVYENGPMLKEEKNLRQEWKVLEEQRKIFERERRNFTEAAIRLSNEVIFLSLCPAAGKQEQPV